MSLSRFLDRVFLTRILYPFSRKLHHIIMCVYVYVDVQLKLTFQKSVPPHPLGVGKGPAHYDVFVSYTHLTLPTNREV